MANKKPTPFGTIRVLTAEEIMKDQEKYHRMFIAMKRREVKAYTSGNVTGPAAELHTKRLKDLEQKWVNLSSGLQEFEKLVDKKN